MVDEKNKALDLDELFGQARAVKVKWQGKEYELLRLEAIGPKQAVHFQQLQLKASKLQNIKKEMTLEQAADLEKLIDEMLQMLCKGLPLNEMTFAMKMRIIMFYMEQTQGKKAMKAALGKLTGATSSRK